MRKSRKNGSKIDSRYMEIMQVAARIIARKGYRGTTIENIATELGLTPAAIYYYFKNKADLLHHIAVDLPEPIDNILKISEFYVSPRDRLKQIIIWLVMFHTKYPEFSVISSESNKYLPKESSDIILNRQKEVEHVLQKALKDGAEQGIFNVDDIKMTSFAILGMCSWTYRWYRPNGRLKSADIADKFVCLLENGYINTNPGTKGYLIHSGDEIIYPPDIEEILIQHPAVKDAVVIAVPDPYWVERVHAIVALKEGTTVTDYELVNYCRKKFLPSKVPKSIEFVDTLPTNIPREKLRANLSEKYWKDSGRRK